MRCDNGRWYCLSLFHSFDVIAVRDEDRMPYQIAGFFKKPDEDPIAMSIPYDDKYMAQCVLDDAFGYSDF